MTTAIAPRRLVEDQNVGSLRARGLHRVIQRVAVAIFAWSAARTAAAAETHQERSTHLYESNATLNREVYAQRLTQRIGL